MSKIRELYHWARLGFCEGVAAWHNRKARQKYPVHKRSFDRWCKSIQKERLFIPAMTADKSAWLLSAYYGNLFKAGLHLIWMFFFWKLHAAHIHSCMWISDKMGWTKVYKIPATVDYLAHEERHGRKCSGSPNCENMNCIEDSIPKWFRVITRI